jgi:hypothetical protein
MLHFGLILFGLSAAISGAIASRILFEEASLEQFQWTYLALMVFGLVTITTPLLVFTPTLVHLKQQGLVQYGAVASLYTQAFQRSKIEQAASLEDRLPGIAEIQSLDSFANSYDRIKKLRMIPIELGDFVAIALPAVIPALPLLATVMPVGDIVEKLFKLLL